MRASEDGSNRKTKLFWFSHLWNKQELQPFLDIPKSLQRYMSSWEALAQLWILLLVNQKCTIRPGIISIQSGSDNTGAEAKHQPRLLQHWSPLGYHQVGFSSTNPMQYFSQHPSHPRWKEHRRWRSKSRQNHQILPKFTSPNSTGWNFQPKAH